MRSAFPNHPARAGARSGPVLAASRYIRRYRRRRRPLTSIASALVLIATGLVAVIGPASADSCAPNPVVCENAKPGTPKSVWDVDGAGDSSIQGFATDMSVNIGQSIDFKIDTNASAYTIDIYRLGWYQGNGARKIASVSPSAVLPQSQPFPCVTDAAPLATGILDCGIWAVSASWTVPDNAVSGVYVATLIRTDNGDRSQIVFVVRDDAGHSDVMFKTSDATWQAYNMYGGADFYHGSENGRAYRVSYNRPFATRGDNSGRDFLFSNEYPMIRFLERNGYDVSYTTDVDADRYGALIRNHRIFMSTGHDEYWSGAERTNVEAARDAGVNLAFFSGNEVYWKTRWEASADGNNTAYRTLVTYKETWDYPNQKDPLDSSVQGGVWTGTWRDPRFSPLSDGGRPENALTGTAYMANTDDLPIQVPADQGLLRLWRNSPVATQAAAGQIATLALHTIGYESDEDLDNGFRPAGLIDLSTTIGPTPQYLQDFGLIVAPGTTTHHITLYRAASGALVFGAGTVQWAWGLDDNHDGVKPPADQSMQQAMVNLFADMGVQPATLMATLTAATASPDNQAPVVTIASPAPGTVVGNGTQVTLTGTASDAGGVVASVEVSTDGGTTWHRAAGTNSWTYSFVSTGVTSQTVFVRGVDDSLNIGSTPASVQIGLTGPASLFGSKVPANPATGDASSVELGVKFTTQTDGAISGIRFYKGPGNTGTHIGSLWSGTGTRLAYGTFTNETDTGWQTLNFVPPVNVTANTPYVASYTAPNGHYAADSWAFIYSGWNSGPLSVQRSAEALGNGVYTAGSGFPNRTFQAANYYVDVQFMDGSTITPTVVSGSPGANAQYVPVTVHPSMVFSKTMNPATVTMTLTTSTGTAVPGTVGYSGATRTVTFTPTAPLNTASQYTATAQGQDMTGNPVGGGNTWTFTTETYASLSTLLFTDLTPNIPATGDSAATELGVKFTTTVGGSIIGVRFYQGAGNSGVHTGSLWTLAGALLAQVTFTGETGSGWQTAHFGTPVPVAAGTTYIASYYAPNGHYAADGSYFTTARTGPDGKVNAPAGTNGVYRYGSDAFPNSSYQSSNYWIDPLFLPGAGSPTPSPSPSPSPSPTPSTSPSSLPPGVISLFSNNTTPTNANWNDAHAIEVGVKFTTDVPGMATGVRFFKGSQNTGPHQGSLWSASGQLLATVAFTNESASGWQLATFSSAVHLTPSTTYVVSYSTTVGYYSANLNYFAVAYNQAAPLHVAINGAAYKYGSGFPNSSSKHNYWADVMFLPDS